MKIAIIGSSGYIGSYMKSMLFNINGCEIIGYDIKPSTFTNYISKGRDVDVSDKDIVIYLAGLSGRASCTNETWGNVYNENITDVMELGRKMTSSQLLIYASTAGILEGSLGNCATETHKIDRKLLDSYTTSMFEREKNLQKLSTNSIGLRFGTVIGISPVQRKDLVHIAMMRAAFLTNNIKVTNPEYHRAILWLGDLERCMREIITRNSSQPISGHNIYNLASFNITIKEIAESISIETGVCYNIVDGLQTHTGGFSLDCNKFCNDYNFTFNGSNSYIVSYLKENIGNICIEDQCICKDCRVCKSDNLSTILDLGYQPLANNFVKEPIVQNVYPLCLDRCIDCNHTQLNYTVRPEVLFRNYQYNSGTSATLRNYFKELAHFCATDCGIKKGRVLEIACNDGSQLDEFKALGWTTYGVDPAINLVKRAIHNGHNIYCGFWGIDKIDLPDQPDIIIAQNVLAHVPDPVVFLKACAAAMNNSTTLYIQTSQCNMYFNGEFDTIYHEHLSFFTEASMIKAAKLSGLYVKDMKKNDIHGTSYFFTMKKGKSDLYIAKETFYTEEFFNKYREKIETIKTWVLRAIDEYVKKGVKIIAYGAAAKGMTMLNYFNIKNVEYIIDDATMKHYKYTPGTNIQVLPVNVIKDEKNICIIVLAWNFFEEIVKNIKIVRSKCPESTYAIKVFPCQDVIMI